MQSNDIGFKFITYLSKQKNEGKHQQCYFTKEFHTRHQYMSKSLLNLRHSRYVFFYSEKIMRATTSVTFFHEIFTIILLFWFSLLSLLMTFPWTFYSVNIILLFTGIVINIAIKGKVKSAALNSCIKISCQQDTKLRILRMNISTCFDRKMETNSSISKFIKEQVFFLILKFMKLMSNTSTIDEILSIVRLKPVVICHKFDE